MDAVLQGCKVVTDIRIVEPQCAKIAGAAVFVRSSRRVRIAVRNHSSVNRCFRNVREFWKL